MSCPTMPCCASTCARATLADQQRGQAAIDDCVAEVAAEHDVRIHLHGGFARPPKPMDAQPPRDCSIWSSAAAPTLARPSAGTTAGGVCDGNNIAACGVPVVDTMGVRGGAIHSRGRISDRRHPGRARAALRAPILRLASGDAAVSFRVRAPRTKARLQPIYEMAKLTGGGFTNLPPDRHALTDKLARSDSGVRPRRATSRATISS